MRVRRLATAVALCVLTSSCADHRPAASAFHQQLNAPYRLDSGDKLRITVFEQDGLTSTYAIDKGGTISMPLIGSVPARGRTPEELETGIAQKLRNGFLRDPDVSVEVDTYRPFFVMGEVTQGGQYSYVPGMTVQNAIAIAGGFTPRADRRMVDVTRQVSGKIVAGRVPITNPIQPGDTISIRERWF